MTLTIPIGASLTEFNRGMDEVGRLVDTTVNKAEQQFAGLGRSLGQGLSQAGPQVEDAGSKVGVIFGTALVASAAAIISRLGTVVNALANIGDRAEDLRLSVNLLQALSVAAGQAGVSTKQLDAALDSFTKQSKAADEQGNKFYIALGNIGKSFVEQFKSAGTQAERLEVLRNAFASTSDEVKRAQLAVQAFGTDSERLTALLTGGGSGFAEYIQRVKDLGLSIDESFVRQAQKARGELATLSRVITDDFSSSLAQLIPVFLRLLPYIQQFGAFIRDSLLAVSDVQTVGTLQRELGTLENELANLLELQDRMQKGTPSAGDDLRSQLRGILGIGEINVDELNKKIFEVEAAIQKTQALLQQTKENAIDIKPGGGDRGAFRPRSTLGGGGGTESAFERETQRIERHTAAMLADALTVGLNKEAHERLRDEMILLNAAIKDGTIAKDADIQKFGELRKEGLSVRDAMEGAGIAIDSKLVASLEKVPAAAGKAAGSLERAQNSFKNFNAALQFAGNEIVGALDGILTKTKSFGDAFTDIMGAVRRALLQAAIFGGGPLAGILGLGPNVAGGTGGLLGGLGGLITGRQAGGPVRGGQPYIVGEHGPELFVPGGSGQIVPSNITRNSFGGTTVAPVYNIDASGADPAAIARLEQALIQLNSSIEARARRMFYEDSRRRF
jgi:hypothetical protein